jgi:tRNA threonylcarbamoyladenosine biosynthesis protein TsaB
MNVLAFDTCFGALSVAVRLQANEQCQLHDAFELRSTGHAERLFPMIAHVLKESGTTLTSMDCIAVTLGPGTFTGVRVGVAAARGLALALSKPVVGMTSLAAMAHEADALLGAERGARPLAVVADARRGMVYFQLFTGSALDSHGPRLATPGQAARDLGEQPALVVGSGAAAVAALAGSNAEARLPDLQPHARALAALTPQLAPLSAVTPLYLREPDVKPQADKALTRGST